MTKPLAISPDTFTGLPIEREARALLDELRQSGDGHSARTWVKDARLKLVLVALREGQTLAEHAAPGAVLVLPVLGALRVRHAKEEVVSEAPLQEAVLMGPGLPHSVVADTDGVLLLVIGPR